MDPFTGRNAGRAGVAIPEPFPGPDLDRDLPAIDLNLRILNEFHFPFLSAGIGSPAGLMKD